LLASGDDHSQHGYDRPLASRRVRRGRPGLTRRRAAALTLIGVVTTFLLATTATARPPDQPRPLTPADFHPIVLPPAASTAPQPAAVAVPSDRLEPIPDFAVEARSFAPRPMPKQSVAARAVVKVPPLRLTGHRVSGSATWYCQAGVSRCHNAYPGGLYAAAGPELRVGDWRGRRVQVCGGGNCVVVTLIDWCACGGNHVIDLYSDAFRRLAPLNSGALHVTVRW
jgi:hypothetical protein